MPQVSIIMPTYNRADTILRALRSIQAQTIQDWELIVVDDGSQDNTAELLAGLDPRLTLVRQTNQGVTAARNTALAYCRGNFLAFLDSDDEWLPYHLELGLAFLAAHPQEQFVSGVLLEDFGNQRYTNHYSIELSEWYPHVAKSIGSSALTLPPGAQDAYLSVYQTRQPLGPWSRQALAHTPHATAWHYSGQIFQHWRWGFLLCLPTTIIRRAAALEIGAFNTQYPICSDFAWLAACCARFRANCLSVPTAVKHELAPGCQPLTEGHLAKHKTQHLAAHEMLRHFELNYCAAAPADPELAALRSHKQLYVAQQKISAGLRDEALQLLQAARPHTKKPLQLLALLLFLKLLPSPAFSQAVYLNWQRFSYAVKIVWRGELSFGQLFSKLAKRLFGRLRYLFSAHEVKPLGTQ